MKASLDTIIGEARELFREHGYAGASMQDLAARVGIRKASLYTRFPTKESLVAEVLALTLRETFADLADESAGWFARYEEVIRRIGKTLADRSRCVGLHLAYGINDETPAAADAVRAYFRQLRDGIARILSATFAPERAREIASDALTRLEGATLWTVIDDDTRPMDRAVSSLLDEVRCAARA
ncbi:MAG: helix-turn-helix domain-containing protein [Dokdonella sp.]